MPASPTVPSAHGRLRGLCAARAARRAALGCAVLLASSAGWGIAAAASGQVEVAQRGRAFQPGELALQRGDTVRFVNDDGTLLHHAYTRSDAFSFDIGEQRPGTAMDVRFPTPGAYTVLCGIHPKMRLQVVVR